MLHSRSLLLIYFICNSVYVNPQFSIYPSSTLFPFLPFLLPSLPSLFLHFSFFFTRNSWIFILFSRL